MRKSRLTEEQIVGLLRRMDAGAKVGEVYRRVRVRRQTYQRWRAKLGNLEMLALNDGHADYRALRGPRGPLLGTLLLAFFALFALAACRDEARSRAEVVAHEKQRARPTTKEAARLRLSAELTSTVKDALSALGDNATPRAVAEACEPLLRANAFGADTGVDERCSIAYVTLALAHLQKGDLAMAGIFIDHHRFTGVFSEEANATAATVAAARARKRAQASEAPANQNPEFSSSEICRAGIALVMGQSPLIMKTSVSGNEVTVSYVRKSDGSAWDYKCKVDGSRIIWGSARGRWRTSSADERLFFSVKGRGAAAQITIEEKYDDGSSSLETFSKGDLR